MSLIKKLLKKYNKNNLYYWKDIYFVVDLSNKEVIPIVFNDDYTSIKRLDTMSVLENNFKAHKNDSYYYVPDYIMQKQKGVKSSTSFLYDNAEYEINQIAIKMLFANNHSNFDFLQDIQILNAEQLDGRYYLCRRIKSLRKHIYSHDIAYTNQQEVLDIKEYIENSKKFKKEIEKLTNEKDAVHSRTF